MVKIFRFVVRRRVSAYIYKKWIIACGLIGCLSMTVGFSYKPSKWDFNYSPVSELSQEEDAGDYIRLLTEGGTYRVKQGDTLWDIAEKQYGTGSRYTDLVEMNRDTLYDPNLILPGQRLILPEILYIPKSHTPDEISQEGAFRIEYADVKSFRELMEPNIRIGNTVGRMTIYTGTVTNRIGYNALTQDWDAFMAEVERTSREVCGDRVTDLTFEKYRMEDGCDLCGYSFTFDMGEDVREVAVFYRLGRQNMAEIIGAREKGKSAALTNAVRYAAASFEDLGGEITAGDDKGEDENVGAGDWNYPQLHNPFSALMDNYGLHIIRDGDEAEEDYEITWEEPLFEQAVRNLMVRLWRMDEEEKMAFMERPVLASDLATVKDLSCSLNYQAATTYETEVTLRLGGDSEEIRLERGDSFSFADIANFPKLESLALRGMPEYDFLFGLPCLKTLSIYSNRPTEDLGFLADCEGLKTLGIRGNGFGMVTDLSVLADMKELQSLALETPRVTDFSFLKECTQIRSIWLEGKRSDGMVPVTPDLDLLPNAETISFYGRTIR
ncbi:MAG: LysM peptidoglycan-binding domain-containing protein [Lachnospiraceae bacterium]|nr:LysM peptidoglycan-binding domain-containing protein [Lachnospiraceae bacterium]